MKHGKTALLFTIGLSTLLTGCNLTHEQFALTPNVAVTPSNVGQGQTIAVKVFNNVPSKQIGIRASDYDPNRAITLTNNLQGMVDHVVTTTLKAQGFKPVRNDASRHLVVTLNSLKYRYDNADTLKTTIHISCSLSVKANAEHETLSRTYKSRVDFKVLTAPSMATDQAYINAVISSALNKMVNDAQLMHLLSQ